MCPFQIIPNLKQDLAHYMTYVAQAPFVKDIQGLSKGSKQVPHNSHGWFLLVDSSQNHKSTMWCPQTVSLFTKPNNTILINSNCRYLITISTISVSWFLRNQHLADLSPYNST